MLRGQVAHWLEINLAYLNFMHLTSLPIDEDRKGWGEWDQKALNYGQQGRETANENVAGMQCKGPCNKACKCETLRMAATDSIGSGLT